MKNSNFLIVYLTALVVGAILILANSYSHLYQGIVVTIGILFLVTSAYMLISAFIRRKDPEGNRLSRPWYLFVVALAGLAFGIWLLCMPGFFIGAAVYTFGVALVIVGFLQVIFIYAGKRRADMAGWWYIVPWLVVAGGFVIIFVGPSRLSHIANIIAGVMLVVYAVNGIFSVASSGLKNHKLDRADRKAELLAERKKEAEAAEKQE